MPREKSLIDENIFSRLKKVRKSLGLTQSDLAHKIGIKQNTYSEIESGKREPQATIISSLAYRFAISEDWLKTGEGEMFKEGKGPYRHPDPTIQKIVELLEGMDEDTKEDVCLSVQKEKLLRDLLKEKQEKKAG